MKFIKFIYFAVLSIVLVITVNITPLIISNDSFLLYAFQIFLMIFSFYTFDCIINRYLPFSHMRNVNSDAIKIDNPIYSDALRRSLTEVCNSIMQKGINDGMKTLLETLLKFIPEFKFGSIAIIDENEYLDFVASIGYNHAKLDDIELKFSDTLFYSESGGFTSVPIIINNIQKKLANRDQFKDSRKLLSYSTLNHETCIACPIIGNDKLIGVIWLESSIPNSFNADDLEIAMMFSFLAGISLNFKNDMDKKYASISRDQLTGVYTRSYFEKKYNEIQVNAISANTNFALVMIDINCLNKINDRHGRAYGDLVLVRFVGIVNEFLAEDDLFARLGGDEFIIILNDIDREEAELKLKKISAHVASNEFEYLSKTIPVSFKYGISYFPDESMILDILMRIANNRLNKSKGS